MRIVGIVATYNEELVIAACLEHHIAQGIEIYLIDNDSEDRTVDIAEGYLGRGLIGIESLPRRGLFELAAQLARKQELARELDADWLVHLDADEMRLAPDNDRTLAEAMAEADAAGYNAVNFLEFTFVPTVESPDHEHPRFRETMRWYYPFLPKSLHQVNAWKKQPVPVDLTTGSGHFVRFPGQFIHPLPFRMRHYQFLSVPHAIRKYSRRRHPPRELAEGKQGWRERLDPASIRLPSRSQLHEMIDGDRLDFSQPRSAHFLDNRAAFRGAPPLIEEAVRSHLRSVPARSLARALIMKAMRRWGQKP